MIFSHFWFIAVSSAKVYKLQTNLECLQHAPYKNQLDKIYIHKEHLLYTSPIKSRE